MTNDTDINPRRILIVGGVAGGASAAARARRMNEDAEIVLFEKDGYPSFANCGLPYYLGGEIADRDKLLVTSADRLHQRFRLDVRTYSEVTRIEREAHQVEVVQRDRHTGEELRRYNASYDKLILATGATPIKPSIPGADAPGVFTLRNLDDTDAIHACLEQISGGEKRRAVIVGGGYIGLEMAEQLHRRGLGVTLVEKGSSLLKLMDPEMTQPLIDTLAEQRIDFRLNSEVTQIETNEQDKVSAAILEDGARLGCDCLVFGIGVKPAAGLAEQAGLTLGASGGIATDDQTRTSDPDIYAVGDASEYLFGPTGARQRVPLAGPANRAGRLAGQHAATDKADPMPPVMGTAIVRVFSTTAALTGLSLRAAEEQGIQASAVTVITPHHVGYYPGARPVTLKLVYESNDGDNPGRILGAQAIGEHGIDKRIDVIATAMRFNGTVRDLAGVDLCYAPPYGAAKDPVHMAAFAACNQLDGLVAVKQPDEDLAGLQVVDVRSDEEVRNTPLPEVDPSDLHHIPLDELRDRLNELDPDRPTVVSCASGQRGYNAARVLMQHGFESVFNLTGAAKIRSRAMQAKHHASGSRK